MHVPKPAIVVFVAALGLLGIGVATAAVGDGEDDPGLVPGESTTVPTIAATTTTPPTTAAPTTAAPDNGEDDTDQPDGQAVERYYGPECGEEIPGGTHGDYVSRAAHDPDGDVTTVAHSDCGKPLSAVHEPPPEAATPAPEADEPKDHPRGGPPGQAKDKGKPKTG